MSDLVQINVGEELRNKIKETILSFIPDDKLDVLIKTEMESFFAKQGYHGSEPSQFHKLIKREVEAYLEPLIEQKVKALLDSKASETEEFINEEYINKGINEYAQIIAPNILQNFFNRLAYNAVQDLRNRSY